MALSYISIQSETKRPISPKLYTVFQYPWLHTPIKCCADSALQFVKLMLTADDRHDL